MLTKIITKLILYNIAIAIITLYIVLLIKEFKTFGYMLQSQMKL